MPSIAQQTNRGSFVPNNFVWELSLIRDIDVTKPEFKELLVRLYQNLNIMATTLNAKTSGYYDTNEYVSGKQYFPVSATTPTSSAMPYRPGYNIVINFGPLPNAATTSKAHGLVFNSSTIFIDVYGAATDPTITTGLPLPYASATAVADNIELWVDGTNVNIATGANYSAYNAYVVLEYLKF